MKEIRTFKTEEGKRLTHESYDRLLASWGIPVREVDVDTSYGKTHVILAGSPSAPPLILFHGVGDDSAVMWILNARELSRHFRLMAVDTLGGSGKSEPDGRYGKGFDLARWLGDVLDGLEIKKAFAAGVSYGAYHVQLLLASFPERIEKIIPLAGYLYAKGYGSGKFAVLGRMIRTMMPEALNPTEENAVRLGSKLAGPNSERLFSDKRFMDHFRLLMKHYNNRAQFVHSRRPFTPAEIELIRARSLFLIGDRDTIAYFPKMRRAMEDFRMNWKIYKDTGHLINHVRPEETHRDFVEFFLGKASGYGTGGETAR